MKILYVSKINVIVKKKMLRRKVETLSDFVRLLIFFIISPVIGIIMGIGFLATSISMICMFLKDLIMEKLK